MDKYTNFIGSLNLYEGNWGSGEFWWTFVVFAIVSYLIGSLNFGQIASKILKNDIGKYGSNNYGATNAERVWGRKGFIFVYLGDSLKIVACGFLIYGISELANLDDMYVILPLSFGVLGHNFPIWFKFKGGKGIAATSGFLFFTNWIIGIFLTILVIILKETTKKVGFAVFWGVWVYFIAMFTTPLWMFGIDEGLGFKLVFKEYYTLQTLIGFALIAIFVTSKNFSDLYDIKKRKLKVSFNIKKVLSES